MCALETVPRLTDGARCRPSRLRIHSLQASTVVYTAGRGLGVNTQQTCGLKREGCGGRELAAPTGGFLPPPDERWWATLLGWSQEEGGGPNA